jgi:luciferase-like monooxygenase
VIFAFIVRKLRWLARVPLFPQIFDTMLLAATALFDRRALAVRESLELEACRSLGVELSVHRFGGVGFNFGGRELAHLHGNGLFDAFVGMRVRDNIVQSGMALPHHVFPRSGWVSFRIKTEADLPNALELMRIAQRYRTNTRAAGA